LSKVAPEFASMSRPPTSILTSWPVAAVIAPPSSAGVSHQAEI
jgi:hypothetical protein